ncbi:MAG: tRNA-dihydrouridine synthase [Bdellovibrionales bacterium]|nr:tRNA-dihydrouridine synthase [Bdellovibrionales bacterium]
MSFWKNLPRPFTCLAPMEDVTDSVFRRLVGECAAPDVYFTEFTSADGLCSVGEQYVAHRLSFTTEEQPLVAQIWGNNPEHYVKTCKRLKDMGFKGIDINMGCPVSKIVKDGACSALIDNPSLAQELYLAAKEGAQDIPVSIKTRLGFRTWKTHEWASFLLSLEPEVLTIHGRIAKEMSEKPARWDEIAEVVRLRNDMNVSTLIIGNGDVQSYEQVQEYHKQYDVDGVMIGRGIFKNLYVFQPNLELQGQSMQEKLRLLLRHAELHEQYWQGQKPYRVLKKYFKIYTKGFARASELRCLMMETSSYDELRSLISSWIEAPLAANL